MLKLAVLTTVYRPFSHMDVIMWRWLKKPAIDPDWGFTPGRSEVASAYVQQSPDNDITHECLDASGVQRFPTIREALTLGGDTLAVDGVVLVAEHGDFPYNEFGQLMYPRKEFFDQVVRVFRKSGRSVPVFCDKHLSWDFDTAREMVHTSEELNFRLTSSSSIPLSPYVPHVDPLTSGQEIVEAVALFPLVDGGRAESYGYHSLEFVQHLLERRSGGERGVQRVTAWRGTEPCEVQRAANTWSADLEELALSHIVHDDAAFQRPTDSLNEDQAFAIEYRDGLKVTHLGLADMHYNGWTVALRTADGHTHVTRAAGGDPALCPHFGSLVRLIEDKCLSEAEGVMGTRRALLTSGTLQSMMHALAQPSEPLETPHLNLAYPSPMRFYGVHDWSGPDDPPQ